MNNSYFDGVIDDYVARAADAVDDNKIRIGDTYYLRGEDSRIPLVLVDFIDESVGKFAYENKHKIQTIELPFDATM